MTRGLTLAWGAVFTLLLAACTVEKDPPIRIGTNTWPGYEPLYLAEDIGAFDAESVRVVRHRSATEVQKAFGDGAIDAAAVTLDEAMLLLEAGRDPRIVLVMDTSKGGDAIIARAGIQRVRDLKGRRLGVEKTALGAYVSARALQMAGLTAADVSIIDLPVDQHASAFLGGAVDAVVTFEPVRSGLLLAGGVEIFSSAEIPGEIVDVLIVDQKFLKKHPERVQQVLRGWFKALDYLKDQPAKASGIISLRTHLSSKAVIKSYSGLELPGFDDNVRLLIGNGGVPGLAPAATRLSETMRSLDLLRGDIRPMRLFVPSGADHPLNTLRAERGL